MEPDRKEDELDSTVTIEDELRAMSLSKFIGFMIETGKYCVDVDRGVVINARTGRELTPSWSGRRRNYRKVALVWNARVIREAAVHRIVAAAAWGWQAIEEREVGHLDGDPSRNEIANLWLPESNAEHDAFDNSGRGLVPAMRKQAWSSCVVCADPDGPIIRDGHTPIRLSGHRFGIDGQMCGRCYHRLMERERKRRLRQSRAESGNRANPTT